MISRNNTTTADAHLLRIPVLASGLPVLGNLLSFRRDLLGFLVRVSREHTDISEIRLGSRRILFLNTPAYAQTMLVDQADAVEKRAGRDRARALLLGNGLINSEGAFHLRERKLCTPAFQPRHIAAFAETMVEYTERIQATWAARSSHTAGGSEATIDLAAQMNRLTLGIAGKTLFGTDLLGEVDELRQALTEARHYIRNQNRSLLHIPLTWPAPGNRRFQAAVARLDATIYRLIEERRQLLGAHHPDHPRSQVPGTQGSDLLSLLLEAHDEDNGTGMNTRQVRDEAVNLFWGGHEPAAITLTATWLLLARHPEVYSRMQAELDRVLDHRPVTAEDLPSLSYTQQVLKEALRLYPPIFAFGRQTLRPIDLNGYALPAGTSLLISPYTLHRRPDIFPDPERFDPERFTPAAEADRHRMAYLPFGSGPRFCIGSHFAQMEALVVLATLGRSVTFTPVKGHRVKPEVIITQPGRNPIPMVVHLRH
jgi:cytochrome P450